MSNPLDGKKRSGSGLRPEGKRTTAKKKALKNKIKAKIRDGAPLNRKEKRKLTRCINSAWKEKVVQENQ